MLTLVLGGARSGKSGYAQSLFPDTGPALYVATAPTGGDTEMKRRITRHRAERPKHFETVDAPFELAETVRNAQVERVLVDCLTLWLSNLCYRYANLGVEARQARIIADVSLFAEACREHEVVVVSNEVGSGVVPETPLGREFRDLQGLANQMLAKEASRVVFMVAGIPMIVKE